VTRRAWLLALGFWTLVAFVVWNGFFDLFVSRGQKHYFAAQAWHELGRGPRVTIDGVMTQTVADALGWSSLWAAFILAAGLGWTACLVRRRARR
jgi:hypothetical protein